MRTHIVEGHCRPIFFRAAGRRGTAVAAYPAMAEPHDEQHVTHRVVEEHVSSTSRGSSVAAWIIIAILAIGLLAYIIVRMT